MVARRKTHEEYVNEVAKINPLIEVVGVYVDAKTKILHRCKVDGYEWFIKPSHVLNGVGCPKCVGLKRRSHDEYVSELAVKNPYVEVVGIYNNTSTKIMHRCLIHNIYWETVPSRALDGMGCEMCRIERKSNSQRKTHRQYVEEVKNINPDIEVLEEYIDAKTSILHKCKKHNIEWKALPNSVLRGCGCLECVKEKIRDKLGKTHEQYVEDLKKVNSNIEVVGLYVNATTPILHRCLIDGYEWFADPNHVLCGRGCPKCSESTGERIVRQWLENNNIQYVSQKTFDGCKDRKLLLFDFYLPEYNLCIEYQGRQHYQPVECFGGEKPFVIQQKHDNIKREYCKKNNIKLLEIPYYANAQEELNNFLFI